MKKVMIILTLISALAILSSCSVTPSTDVKTSSVVGNYSLSSSDGKSVVCSAAFTVGGDTGTYLDLQNGDSVTCNGQAMSRIQDQLTHAIHYEVTLPALAGFTYRVTFSRSGEAPYEASVVLPAAIQLLSPANNAQITKGAGLSAHWTPDTDSDTQVVGILNYSVPAQDGAATTSDSFQSSVESAQRPDTGTLTWSALDPVLRPSVKGNISATLTFTRTLHGTFGPGMRGSISAEQTTSRTVILVD